MSDDFFSDVPDDVLDGAPNTGPDDFVKKKSGADAVDEIIEKAQSTETIEPGDIEQDALLTYVTQSKNIWVRAAPILNPDYFEPEYRPVVRFVHDYYKNHASLPPKRIIKAQTGVKFDVVGEKELADAEDYILQQVDGFCRHNAFLLHAERIADEFAKTKGNMTRNQIAQFLKEGKDIAAISINRDLGIEIHKDAQHYLELDKEFGSIPTGIPFLDKALGGGVSKPSMNVVSAASGQGKSIFLMNIAFNYVLKGKNVVFYTLELEYPMVVRRFAAMMTNTHIDNVPGNIHSVSHQLSSMSRQGHGTLQIMKFPMNTTILDIEAHYKDLCLKTEMEFEVVCIDYIDVMAPADKNVRRNEIHIKDKDISEDMNNFFHENMIIGWTASQQTKTAVEEKELKSSNVSGGRSKVDTSDNLFMLRRNEEEREQEILWCMIKKARSSGGVDSKIPLHWDGGTQRMTDGDSDTFIKENPHIFGKKSKELRERDKAKDNQSKVLKDDAIAKEAGATMEKKERKTGKGQSAADVRNKITRNSAAIKRKLNAGKEDGEESTTSED